MHVNWSFVLGIIVYQVIIDLILVIECRIHNPTCCCSAGACVSIASYPHTFTFYFDDNSVISCWIVPRRIDCIIIIIIIIKTWLIDWELIVVGEFNCPKISGVFSGNNPQLNLGRTATSQFNKISYTDEHFTILDLFLANAQKANVSVSRSTDLLVAPDMYHPPLSISVTISLFSIISIHSHWIFANLVALNFGMAVTEPCGPISNLTICESISSVPTFPCWTPHVNFQQINWAGNLSGTLESIVYHSYTEERWPFERRKLQTDIEAEYVHEILRTTPPQTSRHLLKCLPPRT